MKKYYITIFSIWVLTMIAPIYYAFKQINENKILDQYVSGAKLESNNTALENAILLSTKLRTDFETVESNFKFLDMANRPFLREASDQLLNVKEGQCGEGTRVLVNLLIRLGYNATRVSLYDANLNASHTLVSIIDDGKEYFVDSINTRDNVNHFLNTNQVNSDSFKIVKYGDDVTLRSAESAKLKNTQENNLAQIETVEYRFFQRFKYYSYEAIPYTKLFNATGLDTRIMNFDRPPTFLSSLAEKPYAISSLFYGLLFTGIAIVIFVAVFFLGRSINPSLKSL